VRQSSRSSRWPSTWWCQPGRRWSSRAAPAAARAGSGVGWGCPSGCLLGGVGWWVVGGGGRVRPSHGSGFAPRHRAPLVGHDRAAAAGGRGCGGPERRTGPGRRSPGGSGCPGRGRQGRGDAAGNSRRRGRPGPPGRPPLGHRTRPGWPGTGRPGRAHPAGWPRPRRFRSRTPWSRSTPALGRPGPGTGRQLPAAPASESRARPGPAPRVPARRSGALGSRSGGRAGRSRQCGRLGRRARPASQPGPP
jgi:hypothetical protein